MAAAFIKLEDSPMFHKQIFTLEQTNEELRDRCQMLYKGCTKFVSSLEESCNGDTAFVDSLEAFGGGQDDPVSVSIGGPVISKFVSALHELASYKELLRSQVEHVLVDRLTQFLNVDMQDAKESRRRFDKAEQSYDQAREKFLSLKKSTHEDIVAEHEEELQNSKSAFERSRFGLVNALMNIESKKKYEFLESISAIMDAQLRFFKLGHELLSQLEPFIHEVLTYAQQSKEMATTEQDKLAKRIQEFRTQAELDNLRTSSNVEPTVSAISVHPAHGNSYKDIEAIMQSSANGEVQTIKQGYLSKRSPSVRGEWKRRYFVLDSHGALYYYRNKNNKTMGSHSSYSRLAENNSSVFGRFLSKHNKSSSLGEEILAYQVIDLSTSTIKLDADERDMRLCFRIISPSKSYTLQAENEADQMDWVNNIRAVIAALFNSQFLQLSHGGVKKSRKDNSARSASLNVISADDHENSDHFHEVGGADSVANILRSIPGNNFCAECHSSEPDWASLNLGILLCIECSGLHRNLGVHVSKVRSVSLDVRVWEPALLELFQALGNTYCNSIWEALLQDGTIRLDESESVMKPCPSDAVIQKEKYIQMKYVGKAFINNRTEASNDSLYSNIWQAVKRNDVREVYRMLVMEVADEKVLDTDFDKIMGNDFRDYGDKLKACESDPANCLVMKDPREPANCLRGCSLLHLACHEGNPLMLELMLQFGANINKQDAHGRTPLHHCMALGKNSLAKYLLKRGAHQSVRDSGGFSALERAMEMGSITDEELFILLAESS